MATLNEIEESIRKYKEYKEKGEETSILQGKKENILDNIGKINQNKIIEIERVLNHKPKKFDDGLLKE